MAAELTTPSRRSFLSGASKALAVLSVGAVPVLTHAATPDEWDRLSAALSLVNPWFSDVVSHARNAGMRPQWLFALTNTGNAALLFEMPDGRMRTFYRFGEDQKTERKAA